MPQLSLRGYRSIAALTFSALLGACGRSEPSTAATPDDESKPAKAEGQITFNEVGIDPSPTLGHLPDTTDRTRSEIDRHLEEIIRQENPHSSDQLAARDKAAVLPILGAMARLRDELVRAAPEDSALIEAKLARLDACLRSIDGHLSERHIGSIRPGVGAKYAAYICRLHYRRWNADLRSLKVMPGPFDLDSLQTNFPGVVAAVDPFLKDGRAPVKAMRAIVDADRRTASFLKRQRRHYLVAVPSKLHEFAEFKASIAPTLADGLLNEDRWVRRLVRDGLRALYRQKVGFDPDSSMPRRLDAYERWLSVIRHDE